jgi:hypothetical protein
MYTGRWQRTHARNSQGENKMIAILLAMLISNPLPVYVQVTPADVAYNVFIYPFRDDDGDGQRDPGEASVGAHGTITWPSGELQWDAGHGVAYMNVPPGNRVTVQGAAAVPAWYECYPIQSIDVIPFSGSASIDFPCAPTTLGQMIPMFIQRLLK